MLRMEKLLQDLKKITPQWFWSGNWTIFDLEPFMYPEYQEYWHWAVGNDTRILIAFYHDGILTEWFDKDAHKALAKSIVDTYEKDSNFFKRTLYGYERKVEKDVKNLKSILKKDFKNASKEELFDIFIRARKTLAYNFFMDHYDAFVELYLTPILEKWLSSKLKDNSSDKLAEMVTLLVMPQVKCPYTYEREAFFKITDEIKKNKKLAKKIKKGATQKIFEEYPKIKKKLERHLDKYKHMRVVVNADETNMDDLWKDIKLFVGKEKPYFVKAHRPGDDYNPELIKKAKRLEKELNPDRKTLELIRGIRRAVYMRTLDNEVQGRTTVLLRPLYDEVAERLRITYKELKYLDHKAIKENLGKNGKNLQKLLEKRKKLTCYLWYYDEFLICDTDKAKKIRDIIEKKSTSKKIKEFKGTPASSGKVKGKVRVSLTLKEAEKIKPGEILVSPSTSAYFVTALRKAAGILTEVSSLNNHAIVVAREKKVPCIIGVEDITKHLKTGDTIELDADKGIIKVIKRTL